MIDLVSVETAHYFQDALAALHRFRYRHFIERIGWDVPNVKGMEYDQFDTPGAVYLLWRDLALQVRGMVRLLPTTRPYMIESLWPHLAPPGGAPKCDRIWENTRFAVDADLERDLREKITGELIAASLEFAIDNGVERYLVVSPTWVISRVLKRSGLACEVLKSTNELGRSPVTSAYIDANATSLADVRSKYGITGPVLYKPEALNRVAA
jgi:acyl homoserine lactone synthase